MLNFERLNQILKSLNIQLERINGTLCIHNLDTEITDVIVMHDNKYEYSFIKDETAYHLSFNSSVFKLENELNESITIDSNGFEYCKKDNEQKQNEALVNVNHGILSFFKQNILHATKEEYYSIGTKVQTASNIFLYYRKSETIGLDNALKKDTTIIYDNDQAIKSDHIRNYNSNGHLTNSESEEQVIETDMDKYIIEELASQTHIKELLERINSIIPNINEELIKMNPNLLPIMLKIVDKTKKKQ